LVKPELPGPELEKIEYVRQLFSPAKHWQIFIFFFDVYLAGQMAFMGSILASPRGLLSGLMMALFMLGFFVWF